MSPAANSKSKDRKLAKVSVNSTLGILENGYSPLSETSHTFESIPGSTPRPFHMNGQFHIVDDTEDQNLNPLGAGVEYDTLSNTGSWSGESDDTKDNKEKASPPSRLVPIPGADNDKRVKTRLKNERKHQRQKERRAQELHERCSGYLMSRKLEGLAQQLVAMGFPLERATMALIMNEGRVEESVAWLFEGAEEDKHLEHNLDYAGNLKIDISEELAKITDLEIRYKVRKQEVERAVVASEGDIGKAEEMLKAAKQEHNAALPKSQETGHHPPVADTKSMTSINQTAVKAQPKVAPSTSVQQKRDEKDFNYTNDSTKSGLKALRKPLPKMDSGKMHPNAVSTDRTWPCSGSSPVSFSVSSSLHSSPAPSSIQAHHLTLGDDMKNLQLGSLGEPVFLMQRPLSIPAKQSPSASAGSSPPETRHPSSVDLMKFSGMISPATVPASLRQGNGNPSPSYNQHYQKHFSNNTPNNVSSRSNTFSAWEGASPALSSSLGLYSRQGAKGAASGSSSLVDWNTGSSIPQFDYSNIDWTLDLRLLAPRSNGLWTGASYSSQSNNRNGETFAYGVGMKSAMKPVPTTPFSPFPEHGASGKIPVGSMEQRASPLEDNALSFPRQFVSFPSL